MTSARDREDFQAELAFHRRQWLVQRTGWIVMVLLLGLACAGVFGEGPLSSAVSTGAAVSVEYERFIRRATPATLTVRPHGIRPDADFDIALSGAYLEAFKLDRVMPEPVRTARDGDRLVFTFASRAASAPVVFYLEPERIGSHVTQVALLGEALEIRQFTYP